jgi:hypothetical protein
MIGSRILPLNFLPKIQVKIIMTDKFKEVPIEEGTKIIFRNEAKLGEYDILYEMWRWDGITAESVIFMSEDVVNVTDNDLKSEIRMSPLLKDKDSQITLKRSSSGFTFVNFNFKVE